MQPVDSLVRPEGLEPPTLGSKVSIRENMIEGDRVRESPVSMRRVALSMMRECDCGRFPTVVHTVAELWPQLWLILGPKAGWYRGGCSRP